MAESRSNRNTRQFDLETIDDDDDTDVSPPIPDPNCGILSPIEARDERDAKDGPSSQSIDCSCRTANTINRGDAASVELESIGDDSYASPSVPVPTCGLEALAEECDIRNLENDVKGNINAAKTDKRKDVTEDNENNQNQFPARQTSNRNDVENQAISSSQDNVNSIRIAANGSIFDNVEYFVPTATLVEQQLQHQQEENQHQQEEPARPAIQNHVIDAVLITDEPSIKSSSSTATDNYTLSSSGKATWWKRIAIIASCIALMAVGMTIGFVFGSRNTTSDSIRENSITNNIDSSPNNDDDSYVDDDGNNQTPTGMIFLSSIAPSLPPTISYVPSTSPPFSFSPANSSSSASTSKVPSETSSKKDSPLAETPNLDVDTNDHSQTHSENIPSMPSLTPTQTSTSTQTSISTSPLYTPTPYPSLPFQPTYHPSKNPISKPPSNPPSKTDITPPSFSPTHHPTTGSPTNYESVTISQKAKLLPRDGSTGDTFGCSIDIHSNTLVIGADRTDDNDLQSGAAYVFVKDEQTGEWKEEAKLLPRDGVDYDFFGQNVAIYGDIAVVAAPFDDDIGSGSGSVYVFARDVATEVWREEAKLVASDGDRYAHFGWSVDVYDDTVVVGSHQNDVTGDNFGAAYVFVRHADDSVDNGVVWREEAKLLPADVAEADRFGERVGIYENTVVVGVTHDDDNGDRSGSAYVFARDERSGIWTEEAKLLPSNGSEGDRFGVSVGIHGDIVVVGATLDDTDDNGVDGGSVYVFVRDENGGGWNEQAILLPIDGVDGDNFGYDVAIYNDTLVIGTGKDDVSESAYVFTRDEQSWIWTEQWRLQPTDGVQGDNFGWGVAMYGDAIIVSANADDDNGEDSGSVYLFSLNK